MFIWGSGFGSRNLLLSLLVMFVIMGVLMMMFRGEQWPVAIFCCWPGLFPLMFRHSNNEEEKAKRKRKNEEFSDGEPRIITTREGESLEVVDTPREGGARIYPTDDPLE